MRKPALHIQILIGMLLGGALGLGLNVAGSTGAIDRAWVLGVADGGAWLGKVFLTLLNMVVVPLVFTSIVASITGIGQGKGLARLGMRTAIYYTCTSIVAITVGLVIVNVIRPGEGLDYNLLASAAQGELQTRQVAPPDVAAKAEGGAIAVVSGVVTRMIPTNVFDAATSNRAILSIIFFAILTGLSAISVGGTTLKTVDQVCRAFYEVMVRMTQGILHVAPFGIAGYLMFVTASTGLALAGSLAWYMLAVAVGLLFHALVTLPALLWWTTGMSAWRLAGHMKEALLTAFSTASSAGTLPLTIRNATENARLPERVTTFTLPLGATVNMDGTALYEVVAVLFVSQMIGDLTLFQQGVVALTALTVSIGAAGIPHAGTVMMVIVMHAVGLPTDAILILIAVDRVLDMMRTTVNVWSDSVGAAILSHYEGRS